MPSSLEQIPESIQLPTVELMKDDATKWTRDFLALLEEQYNLFVTAVKEMLVPAYVIARQGDLQASVNEAVVTGRSLYIAGQIFVNGETTIPAALKIFGNGNTSQIIQTNLTANTFKITTTDPCYFEDFVITHQGTPTQGAGLYFDSGGAANVASKLRGVRFFNLFEGVHFERGAAWHVEHCEFVQCKSIGLYQKNPNFGGDEGDSGVINTTFFDIPKCFVCDSGAGIRIVGCKMNVCAKGIELNINVGINTSILLVTGCSIENFTTHGIDVLKIGAGTFLFLAVTGCEFGNYVGTAPACIHINADTFQHLTVTGCHFALAGGARIGVDLVAGELATIMGNEIRSTVVGTTTGINIAAAFASTLVGENNYNNIFTPVFNLSGTTRIDARYGQTLAAIGVNMGAPANGSLIFCSNCKGVQDAGWAAGVCVGTAPATGAQARRIAGIWNCA